MSRLSFMTVALYLKWMEEHSFLPDEDLTLTDSIVRSKAYLEKFL